MAVEDRRTHEERLVQGWYDHVVGAGGRPLDEFPFSAAWEQYRRAVLFTTVYPVTAASAMDPANERERELVAAMAVLVLLGRARPRERALSMCRRACFGTLFRNGVPITVPAWRTWSPTRATAPSPRS